MTSRPHHPDPAFATTLAHGLGLLQCFRAGETVLSNKELADRTGLSKATISRLTYTLAARGLLLYDSALAPLSAGLHGASLGYPLLASLGVRQLARPLMKRLSDRMGGTVSLGMRDRLHMVYVETVRGHDAIAFRPEIGASLPMLTTAMGRAWLAQAPEAVRAPVVAGLRDARDGRMRDHAQAVPEAIEHLARLRLHAHAGRLAARRARRGRAHAHADRRGNPDLQLRRAGQPPGLPTCSSSAWAWA